MKRLGVKVCDNKVVFKQLNKIYNRSCIKYKK